MKSYELNRIVVLIELMAECIGCGENDILAPLTGNCISEQEAGEIYQIIKDHNQ